ncbi:Flp family type IVb pilin [Phytopseudomonas seleniipraecipitans]|uniref:Pilus assembly protein Flp/PilA n=1 Tax=Phytopseudomonas seleniipraecipitans TaxID=640205 RepID=A0A1G7URX6_9GAMM|nr:Flp family type IVb pilin [Pseudomonas seleniipraecipitans]SDG50264.1 pilus assembly protein Flp/PilA [Pseudomonas seleniipraecipitans]
MFKLIILREKIREFFRKEDGASAIEYSIIAALIAVVIVTAVTNVGEEINNVFGDILAALQGVDGEE